jgi:hypothetical protein
MVAGEERLKRVLTTTRVRWAGFAGLVALHVVLAALLFDPKPFVGGDNAGYMILAESIESGQGYRDIELPDSPRHGRFPPLYPAVLAVAGMLGGGLIAFKTLSMICTTLAVVFFFGLARRRLGWEGGLAAAAPVALSPVLLYYSHWVLADALFVALTLLALCASERSEGSLRWLALSVGAALLAFLASAPGLPLILALLIAMAWRKSWRRLAETAVPVALTLGGWWLWVGLAGSRVAVAGSGNFLLADPFAPELGYVGPGELLARTVNNVRAYSADVLPQSLAGVSPGGGLSLIALFAALLLLALAMVAWVREVRRVRVLELFAVLYAGAIFVWPSVWLDRRLLLPLLPILILYAVTGVIWCFDFLRARRPAWVLPAVGVVLVFLTVSDNVRRVAYNQRCIKFYRQGDHLACYPPPWRAFVQTAHWVRDNTPADAVVVSQDPRLYYLFSERRGTMFPLTSDDATMLAFFDETGVDYVALAGPSPANYRYLVPVIRSVTERFIVEHAIGEETMPAYVLRYMPETVDANIPEGR